MAGGTLEILRWLLGWGDAVEVVQPPRLRALVTAAHRAALAAYRGRGRVRLDRTGPR